jgi:hypothetical protein
MATEQEELESSLDRLVLLQAKVQMCITADATRPSARTARGLVAAWEQYCSERAKHPGWREPDA